MFSTAFYLFEILDGMYANPCVAASLYSKKAYAAGQQRHCFTVCAKPPSMPADNSGSANAGSDSLVQSCIDYNAVPDDSYSAGSFSRFLA